MSVGAAFALFSEPPPASRADLLAVVAAVAAYNAWMMRLGRMPARTARTAMAFAVALDFVVCAAFEFSTLDQPNVAHWPIFMIVSFEAAIVFGWKGTTAFLAAFVPWFFGSTALGHQWFGWTYTLQGMLSATGMVAAMSLLAGATATTSWKRQAAIESARAEVQLRADRLTLLNQISFAVSAHLHEQSVIDATLECLHELFPRQWHGVLLSDAADGARLARSDGEPRELRTRWPLGWCRDKGRALVLARLWDRAPDSDRRASVPWEWRPYRSLVMVPLDSRDQRLGWLVALDPAIGQFGETDVALFETLGSHLSLAIDNARTHEESVRRSLTDALTGLPNRHAFEARIVEQHNPVAFLMIDLDGFKEVNDTFGHHCGDAVLVETARRIEAVSRADDFVARLGGDEFLVRLDRPISQDEARSLAERIAALIRTPMTIEGHEIAIGASVGAAVRMFETVDPEELLRRADDAMYEAKRSRSRPVPKAEVERPRP